MKDKLKKVVATSLESVLEYPIENYSENILSLVSKSGHTLVDLIYFFDDLEKQTALPVSKIVENRSYSVMTVNNITNAIIEDFM